MRQSELSSFDIAAIRTRVQGNAARAKDKQVKNPVANPGAPSRKASAKLSARIGDYARMVDSGKADSYSGYHKPGSMQR